MALGGPANRRAGQDHRGRNGGGPVMALGGARNMAHAVHLAHAAMEEGR